MIRFEKDVLLMMMYKMISSMVKIMTINILGSGLIMAHSKYQIPLILVNKASNS